MTKKCDYCVYRNTLECKKSPVPKDLICDDFMLDICALSNKEQIAIQKMLIEEYRDTITRNQNFFDMAIEALDKQDVSEINVGDTISRQAAIDAIKTSRYLVDAMEKIIRLPSAQSEEVTPHRNYKYLSDYWCECGNHLGKKGSVTFCSDCGRKVKWDE